VTEIVFARLGNISNVERRLQHARIDSMPFATEKTKLLPVPMLDFKREFAVIREEAMAAIAGVCESQKFILGPEVERFELAAARECDVKHAVGCASGTDALWLAMSALEIGPGDAVVTSPFSFFASVSSILRVGAKPLLADIDEKTFNLSPDAVKQVLKDNRVAAVMPVHLYGQCADMSQFAELASEHQFKLVEDAAQAFGATWDSVHAGALGAAAAFSFYPTKNLSAFGDAGMATTADDSVAERMKMLRAHGMRKRYFHDEVGWNCRIDTIQAAVLEIKLRRVDAGNAKRRELAARYDSLLLGAGVIGATTTDGIVLPYTDPRADHVFHQYVIRAPKRDALREFLTSHGIGSEIYYPLPLHLQTSLKDLGYKAGDFPVAERAAAEVLALPMYPELRDDEQESVVEAIRQFYS
jgi:dTDP-4-amino-4,6-dideoxygalactose transaminase